MRFGLLNINLIDISLLSWMSSYILFEFSEQRATAKQNPQPGGVEIAAHFISCQLINNLSTTLVSDCVGVRSGQVHMVEETFSVFISAKCPTFKWVTIFYTSSQGLPSARITVKLC